MTSLDSSESRRSSRREGDKRAQPVRDTSSEPLATADVLSQRRSTRKKSDAAESLEQHKAATEAKESDAAASTAASKRAYHPDPLKPEQAQELGITGVAKDDNVFLVDKILDERYKLGKLQYLIKWKGFSAKYNTWEPASNILTPELLEEYKVGKKGGDTNDLVTESPKKVARGGSNPSPVPPASNGESAESGAGGSRNRRKRKNSVASISEEPVVEETPAPAAIEAIKSEPVEEKSAKKSPEARDPKAANSTSPYAASAGATEAKAHTVAEVAEFRFVEQELDERPISNNVDSRGPYSPDQNMDDLGSDDDQGDNSGDGEGDGEDSEYSTAAPGGGEAKSRRKSEPSWARKGYKDWDDDEEELLLNALKKYGPRFFDEDKLAESGLGHRPPNAVRAKYRRMWMAGRAPKPKNADGAPKRNSTSPPSSSSAPITPSSLPRGNVPSPASAPKAHVHTHTQTHALSHGHTHVAQSHIHTAKPPPPAAAASFSASAAAGMSGAGLHLARPTLPSLAPPLGSAPVLTLPEPLQPPLIYSSGPLATHPSNPLVARFMAPHQSMMQGNLARMPQLLPRAPNPVNSPPPGSSVLSPPHPPRSTAPLKGSLACEACRYMHVRCNGSHPCDQCTRRRVPCSFSTYNKRKGPSSGIPVVATASPSPSPSAASAPQFSKWSDSTVKCPPPGYLIGPDGAAWPQQQVRRATFAAGAGMSLSNSTQSPSIPRAIAPAPPPPPPPPHALTEHNPLAPVSLMQRVAIPMPVSSTDRRSIGLSPVPHVPSGGPLGFPGRLVPPPDYLLRVSDQLRGEQDNLLHDETSPRPSGAFDSRNAETVLAVVNRHWHQLNRINWCRQHKDVAPVYASVADMITRGPGAELDVGAVYFTLEEWRTVSRALHKLGFAVRGRTIMVTTAVIEIFPLLREAFTKQRAG